MDESEEDPHEPQRIPGVKAEHSGLVVTHNQEDSCNVKMECEADSDDDRPVEFGVDAGEGAQYSYSSDVDIEDGPSVKREDHDYHEEAAEENGVSRSEGSVSASSSGESDLEQQEGSSTSEDSSGERELLETLQTICVAQTCMTLIDSSSSDDDDLLLMWWYLYLKKKKRLRKRKRLVK